MVRIRWRGDPFEESPLGNLNRLRDEMNRLFEGYYAPERFTFGVGVYPAVNVYEEADTFRVTAELPGMDPGDIDISVQGDNLVLRGESKPQTGEGVSYHRRERRSGAFNRVLSLPERVDAGKVSAEYVKGVLRVTLPKAEEAKPRRISVSAG